MSKKILLLGFAVSIEAFGYEAELLESWVCVPTAKETQYIQEVVDARTAHSWFSRTVQVPAQAEENSASQLSQSLEPSAAFYVKMPDVRKQNLVTEAGNLAEAAYKINIGGAEGNAAVEKVIEGKTDIVTFSANLPNRVLPAGLVTLHEENGRKKLSLAFRGTMNQYFDEDMLRTNINAWKSEKSGLFGNLVHKGFETRYCQARENLIAVINEVLEIHNIRKEDVDVLVTGHSLGGAMATLGAYDLKRNLGFANVDLVTWNSPRVLATKAAADFENLFKGHAVRIWREWDPVSMVPPGFIGYKHVGEQVKMSYDEYKLAKPIAPHAMTCNANDLKNAEKVKPVLDHKGVGGITGALTTAFSKLKFW